MLNQVLLSASESWEISLRVSDNQNLLIGWWQLKTFHSSQKVGLCGISIEEPRKEVNLGLGPLKAFLEPDTRNVPHISSIA